MRKKILAVGSALLLVAGLISLGAGPATAGGAGTNDETTWQTLPNETCIKIEPVTVVPYLLPALEAGQSYSKVIVKAGSTGNSVTNENTIYVVSDTALSDYPDAIVGPLAPGTPVEHAEKDSISHIILCTVPTPPVVVTSVPAVTFVDECAVGNDSVSVPTQTGVVYTTTDNRTAGVGTVTVTAAPAPGYQFAGSVTTTQWSHDFTNTDCGSNLTVVTSVPAVTFVDECAVGNDSVSVPTQTGVVYTTTDNRTAAGVGTVTVTAAPAPGFKFAGSVTTQWSHDFTNDVCDLDTLGLVTPVVTSTNLSCTADGSYTLGEANGVNDGIIWTVNGTVVQPGTVSVKSASTIHVTAVPNGIEHGFEFGIDNPSTWTLTFTAPQVCGDLTTLALPGDNTLAATGADSDTVNFGLLFAGGLLLLGGALLVADRKVRYGK